MKYKLLLILLFPILATAQTPGYMGKHMVIGYSNNFFVAGIGPMADSEGAGINTTHCFNLEYVIKNRTNICFSFQTLKTGMTFSNQIYSKFEDATMGIYDNHVLHYPDKPMLMQTKNVGIGLKFFKRGTYAPLGKYQKVELLLLFTKLSYKKNSFYYYDDMTDATVNTSIGKGVYNFSTFAFTYTVGRQRVLFDKLVLDYGMQIGFTPSGVVAQILDEEGGHVSGTNDAIEDAFREGTNLRLFRHQLFNLHIGLGFLVF